MRRGETVGQWLERTDARLARIMVAPHYVYRAFDSYGHLLYVGCTKNVDQRLSAHRHQSPWHRFAETIAVAGPYDGRDAGRDAEMQAILTEAPYFNSPPENHSRTQANLNAAKHSLWGRGWYEPQNSLDPLEDMAAWSAEQDRIAPEQEAWRRGLERERARLKAGAFPYLTDEDRIARYLAAREDAENARLETAA